jgi:hypothetical protein
LSEDKLRMIRAVRFAATFDFTIEPATFRAIQEMAHEISTVSAERIGMEIRRMLLDPNRAAALRLLHETSLLAQVLPEAASLPPAEFENTARILAALDDPTFSLAFAALLFHVDTECSPPVYVPTHPNPRPSEGGEQAEFRDAARDIGQAVGRRLRFTNKEIERTVWLLANRPALAKAPQLPWPRVQRVLVHDGATELLALHEAVAGAADPALLFCRERLGWPIERLNPRPLVDGSDLIGHGLAPGPHFSLLLEQIRDAQLLGQIHTRDEALALADRLRQASETLP